MVHQKKKIAEKQISGEDEEEKPFYLIFSWNSLKIVVVPFFLKNSTTRNDSQRNCSTANPFLFVATTMNMVNHSVIIATSCVPLINSTMRTVLHFYFWQRLVEGDIFLVLADWLIKIF